METTLTTFASRMAAVDLAAAPTVPALNTQADPNPGCVYAKNLVANAIRDVVTRTAPPTRPAREVHRARRRRPRHPVLPLSGHCRDRPGVDYFPPVDTTRRPRPACVNYVPRRTPMARARPCRQGVDLPVPDLPVGRLVETPTEIIGMLTPTWLPTAWFRTDHITRHRLRLHGERGDHGEGRPRPRRRRDGDTLISPRARPPSASWTATQLQTQLFGKRHDLIFLGGHFSANNTLAADNSTTLTTDDLADSTVNLRTPSSSARVATRATPSSTATPSRT